MVKFRTAPKDPLKAMAPDKFVLGRQSLEFLEVRRKEDHGFRLSIGRAGGIEFVKKKIERRAPLSLAMNDIQVIKLLTRP